MIVANLWAITSIVTPAKHSLIVAVILASVLSISTDQPPAEATSGKGRTHSRPMK